MRMRYWTMGVHFQFTLRRCGHALRLENSSCASGVGVARRLVDEWPCRPVWSSQSGLLGLSVLHGTYYRYLRSTVLPIHACTVGGSAGCMV